MRLQIFSDLHADVLPIKPVTIADNIDAVIVAGDTCEGASRAFARLRQIVPSHIPLIVVMGNHEYYRRFLPLELKEARMLAPQFNIHLLEDAEITLGGVRFMGATLWTDYRMFGNALQIPVMQTCGSDMNDHRRIGYQKSPWRRFRPQEADLLHHRSRSFLEEALNSPSDGAPTVVVTHHAVHLNSVDPAYRDDWLTAAYVSDLSQLIATTQPNLWVHGHVHKSFDYHVGQTRIVCNPHGYGGENPTFDGALVVEVGS
ncbi:metallophosphoesterase [Bradyrhizobium sp. LA2.1]|uniref:metallophosphoesterase family protein n=1 Tax=Bradyrhizobium sp. LA2.1 TaxID=3156376 RepID=UPI00339AF209